VAKFAKDGEDRMVLRRDGRRRDQERDTAGQGCQKRNHNPMKTHRSQFPYQSST
jgi:hypothetical protein